MTFVDMIPYQCESPSAMGSSPMQLNAFSATASKKSKKRVRFQPTVTVQPVDCVLTQNEKARSYYSIGELKEFSIEAKRIRASSSSICGAHATRRDCMLGLEADPALRGLELHLCPIRVRNKLLAERALLKHHRAISDKTSEEKSLSLASTSVKLTQWSKLVAIETARLDSIRAYEAEYLIPINTPVAITPFPATTRRRRVTIDEDDQPAKRRRC